MINCTPHNQSNQWNFCTLLNTVVTLSRKRNQKISQIPGKRFERSFIGMNTKQKVRIKKIRQININIFSNQTLLELIDYLF